MMGRDSCTTLFPSRRSASHGPTPAAATRTTNSPSFGLGHGISSITIAFGGPKWWILPAFIFPPEDDPARCQANVSEMPNPLCSCGVDVDRTRQAEASKLMRATARVRSYEMIDAILFRIGALLKQAL